MAGRAGRFEPGARVAPAATVAISVLVLTPLPPKARPRYCRRRRLPLRRQLRPAPCAATPSTLAGRGRATGTCLQLPDIPPASSPQPFNQYIKDRYCIPGISSASPSSVHVPQVPGAVRQAGRTPGKWGSPCPIHG